MRPLFFGQWDPFARVVTLKCRVCVDSLLSNNLKADCKQNDDTIIHNQSLRVQVYLSAATKISPNMQLVLCSAQPRIGTFVTPAARTFTTPTKIRYSLLKLFPHLYHCVECFKVFPVISQLSAVGLAKLDSSEYSAPP